MFNVKLKQSSQIFHENISNTIIGNNFKLLEKIIGYEFHNIELLIMAFTHKTFKKTL